ncbi:MAG: hypothetical protein QOJ39_765 [Candidatus Eremiobacteraeota bacterium]|nr:hypothetical protein [Candidatus Eremiobacteraeota bacterium]
MNKRRIPTDGTTYASPKSGTLVLLLHGFPDSSGFDAIRSRRSPGPAWLIAALFPERVDWLVGVSVGHPATSLKMTSPILDSYAVCFP